MKDCKIYTNGRSTEIQGKLLKLGVKHYDIEAGEEVELNMPVNLTCPFIYVQSGRMWTGSNMITFAGSILPEISAEDIVKIEMHQFKPFDRVLVRDADDEEWKPDIFSYMAPDSSQVFQCIGEGWGQCIPYEGNEHLVGTKNNKI